MHAQPIVLALLLSACATSGVTPERRAEILAAVDDCYPAHRQTVLRYEVDRFGQIFAYRWENPWRRSDASYVESRPAR